MSRLLLAVALLGFVATASAPAHAAAEPIEYLWTWNGREFDSLEQTLDALNAKAAGERRVEQYGNTTISGNGRSLNYRFKVPAFALLPTGAGDIYSGYGCSWGECLSEGDAIAAQIALREELFSHCNASLTPIDAWQPASWGAHIGDPTNYFRYERHFQYSYGVPNLSGVCVQKPPEAVAHEISRWVPMTSCPAGYETEIVDGDSIEGGRCVEAVLSAASVYAHAKPDCCAKQVGNPIAITNGAKLERETDCGSATLALTRSYSSLLQTAQYARLGLGWTHNFARHLVLVIDGSVGLAVRGGGEQVPFVKVTSTRWIAIGGRALTALKVAGGYTLSGTDGAVEHYSTTGRLLKTVDRAGRIVESLTYDSAGRLATVTDADGRELVFGYSTEGRLATVTDPAGGVYHYAYDARGALTGVTNPAGETRSYHYEHPTFHHHLTGITDAAGQRLATFGYDSLGRATSTEHAGGLDRHTVQYLTNGQVRVTDPAGAQQTYSFKAVRFANLVTAATGTVGGDGSTEAAAVYNANGHKTQSTDLRGTVTRWTRDADGRETSRTEAYGTPEARTVATQWHATLNLPVKVTEPDRETEYQYSATGSLLSETVRDTATGEARTTTRTYTADGRRETTDGPRTNVLDITRWEYDTQGNVARVINALGQTTHYTYDAHGNPATVTDPNGVVTTLAYDAAQRLVSRSVAGAETLYEYTADGQLGEMTAPDGSILEYEYDAAHRLSAIEDGVGNRIEYTLDARGNRIEERTLDPAGVLTRQLNREFDARQRLAKLITASGTTEYAYDAVGNRVSVKDPLNRLMASTFDPLNRLTQITDPANGVTKNAYDARGNLLEVIDSKGVTTRYAYDGFDQVIRVESPDAGTTFYSYDAAGNRVSQTDARGVTTLYSYDALNRLTAIRYPNSALDITYTWDIAPNGVGKVASIQDGAHRVDYQYDTRGRVIEERRTIEGVTLVVGYAYDAADRLAELTFPSGARVVYARDTLGQIQSVTLHRADGTIADLATGITYQPFGRITGYIDGAGREHARAYDLDGRLLSLDTLGVQGVSYGYDAAGNPTSIADLLAPQNSQAFGYDALDRLTSASGAYGSQAWTYDSVGNRLTESDDGAIESYAYPTDSHRLLSVGGRGYQYDAAGNTLNDGQFNYVYDARNRLSEVWSADDATRLARYAHNAQGQRSLKVAGAPDTTDYTALAAAAQLQADQHRAQGEQFAVDAEQHLAEADGRETEAAEARATQDAALEAAAGYRADEAETRADAEAAFAAASAAADAAHLAGIAADVAAQQARQAATVATLQAIVLREHAEAASTAASAAKAEGEVLAEAAAQARTDAVAQEAYALDQLNQQAALEVEAQAQLALEAQLRAVAAELLAEAEPELAKARFFRAKIVTPPKNFGQKVTNLVFELLARMFERRVEDLTSEAAEKLAAADVAHAASLTASTEAIAAGERSATATELAITLRAQAEADEAQASVLLAEAATLSQQAAQASAQAGILETVALQQATVRDAALVEAASHYANESAIRAAAETALAQATAEADALHALAEAKDAEAITAEQASIAATNAAITLREQAAEATEAAAEAYLLADAAQTEADHYLYLAENPPNTEQTTLFAYDNVGHLIGEYDEVGNLKREYVWLGDMPLAMLTTDATFSVQADHLNTPVSMTDSSGVLVWQANREPFGETPLAVAAVEQNLRFPGQYVDQETGLHQNWNREYDPTSGRYTQSDPIGTTGGRSIYIYGDAAPTTRYDTMGLFASHVHRELTFMALGSVPTCSAFGSLPRAVANVDFEPSLQDSQSRKNSHWHGMRPPRQSVRTAEALYEMYINQQLSRCNTAGLARALHAAQDSVADGHRFREYDGLVGIAHVVHDYFPSAWSRMYAIDYSRSVLEQFMERCPCACN